ncbi:hypothetical protein BH23CYA1_BH23CYA1_10490 [soil metagenome]
MTANNGLKTQLEAACDDLWWSSESDYPVEVIWFAAPAESADGDQESLVRELIGCEGEVETVDIEDFFSRSTALKSWHTAEDKAQISRLQQLKTLLQSALTNPRVYRCGEVEVRVYAVGHTPDGGIAGVKTTLVET